MSMFNRLRDLFRGESAPPALRNKPGGMAWIRGVPTGFGAEVLNGHIVQIKHASPVDVGAWVVDPPQGFTITHHCTGRAGSYLPGMRLVLPAIEDEYLQPIPDTGITSEEVDQLYLSSPVKTTEHA